MIAKPEIRLATKEDFDSLYEIWMQDHINPFMSFEHMPKDEFIPIFNDLFNESEIYVIELDQKIVAVRRLIYGKGDYSHTAYFASFGVHEDELRKGYGQLFYKFMLDKTDQHKFIKRIEISQETDNKAAFVLAKKMGFIEEAISPEWLIRTTGTHAQKWYIGERFCALLKEDSLPSVKLEQKSPTLPLLVDSTETIHLIKDNDIYHCYLHDKLQLTCKVSSGTRRYDHIGFLEIEKIFVDNRVAQACLRQLFVLLSQQYKKIEATISDPQMLDLLNNLGFHCRGVKKSAKAKADCCYDEVIMDFGFFNINDAKVMLTNLKDAKIPIFKIIRALNDCLTLIENKEKDKEIDNFSSVYLQNLAFQLIREGLVESFYLNQEVWPAIIDRLPVDFKENFFYLGQLANLVATEDGIEYCAEEENKYLSAYC